MREKSRWVVASAILSVSASAWAMPPKQVPPILDEKALDRSVNPCDDFYKFSCGGWEDNTPLPDDKPMIFRQGSDLDDINQEAMRRILEGFSSNRAPSQPAAEKKLGDFYRSCVTPDPDKTMASLNARLAEIDTVQSAKSLADVVADLHLVGVNALFSFGGQVDMNDSSVNAAYFDEGGLGLPNREAYLGDPKNPSDEKWKETLKEYRGHIADMLRRSGDNWSRGHARDVLALEKALATGSMSREDRRDPQKLNNPMTVEDFKKLAPSFDWDHYLMAVGQPNLAKVIVASPGFFKSLETLVSGGNWDVIRSYLKWRVVTASAPYMGGDFEQAHFDFYGKYLTGQKKLKERWKTCVAVVGDALTDLLGQEYVKSVKDAGAVRKAADQMLDTVKATFQDELQTLGWLDAPTRSAAIEKLGKLKRKIGYPDKWKDYASLNVTPDSILDNVAASESYAVKENLSEIGKPVDHTRWDMPPWEVNAYYDPSVNEFVFPLAQLVPPSMDLNASDGANWGALGATLGHEMSHGYDDEGHQYDGDGNLKDWWSKPVSDEFAKRSSCYSDAADKYEALPGIFVNGKATLGENLADQGGTKFAYLAYKKVAAARGTKAPDWAGFNEDQQFYISYAQSWCAKETDEHRRKQVQTNEHPPADFRVNMVVKNLDSFRKAFSCAEGTPMAPKDTCSLW